MTATFAADAVLAAVLPADATRVRVGDVLTSLDGDTGRAPADVDLGATAGELDGAPVGVLVVDADAGGLDTGAGGRLAIRVRDHVAMRWRTTRDRRRLHAAGFGDVTAIAWDRGQVAHLPAPSRPARPLRAAERLPRRAALIGRRAGGRTPSILSAAASAAGLGPTPPWPLVRSGTLVVLGDGVVLRVAVGAGRLRLRRAAEALARASTTLDRPELLPSLLGEGTVGLGAWTTERRLSGTPCPTDLPDRVAVDVLDLLAGLHGAGRTPPAPVTDAAAVVAAGLGADPRVHAIRDIADDVAPALDGLPGALGHGDFWHGNLLLRDRRLAGVIDWDAAGDGALPFTDLLHLLVAARVPKGGTAWGRVVADELVSARPSPLLAHHGRAVGIDLDPSLRRALVAGYWLDRLATQLRTYGDRVARPRWLAAHVDPVLLAWNGVTR